MKLAATFNVWGDSIDLLPYSLQNIAPLVDGVIVVYSIQSNYGVKDLRMGNTTFLKSLSGEYLHKVSFFQLEPKLGDAPHANETRKRNYCLDVAREAGYTHILMMDGDEFYKAEEFEQERELIYTNHTAGAVCGTQVYFKKPTLTVGRDHTLVPFIHKITPNLKFGNFPDYPFNLDSQGNAHIDPTRRMNIIDGVYFTDRILMHHYSWVRSDYNMKIENSSAAKNLKKSSIYTDLENAREGEYNEFYRSHLVTCENYFKLPEL